MLYNYPGRTGVDMNPAFIERLTELGSVQYVKESTGEMPRITELIRRCGRRLGVFCGCDTLAMESLVVGAIGWVGGVVNVLPAAHVKLFTTASKRRLCGGPRVLLRDAAAAGNHGRGRQVHAVRESGLQADGSRRRPAPPTFGRAQRCRNGNAAYRTRAMATEIAAHAR